MVTGTNIRPKARLVRVYGGSDVYGEERTDPVGEPLIAPDFPTAGDRGLVWLGAVPDWLPTARWHRRAIGSALLRTRFGFAEGQSMAELIQERLDSESRPTFDGPWYVTVAIEREVEIRAAQPGLPDLIWVESEDVEPLLETFKDEFAAPLNVLAAAVEDGLGLPGLFERVVLEDHLDFFEHDRPPLSMPMLEGQAGSINIKKGAGEAVLSHLTQRVATLGPKWPALKGLERAIHWYLAALNTSDTWNRFQWAFLALEILTHKLAPTHYSDVCERLAFEPGDGERIVAASFGGLVPPIQRLPLDPRFTIVALALSPSTAERDIAVFAQVKQARDDLAHGQITDPGYLPDSAALDLIRRYLHLALT
jgi:hypothetical protein